MTYRDQFERLIAGTLDGRSFRDAEDFLAGNPDLLRSEALSTWYSKPRLTSPLARRVALLPDRVSGPA